MAFGEWATPRPPSLHQRSELGIGEAGAGWSLRRDSSRLGMPTKKCTGTDADIRGRGRGAAPSSSASVVPGSTPTGGVGPHCAEEAEVRLKAEPSSCSLLVQRQLVSGGQAPSGSTRRLRPEELGADLLDTHLVDGCEYLVEPVVGDSRPD